MGYIFTFLNVYFEAQKARLTIFFFSFLGVFRQDLALYPRMTLCLDQTDFELEAVLLSLPSKWFDYMRALFVSIL